MTAPSDTPAPARSCDVVMKGGITSGIVYPLAVSELARSYRFRNIGGTSAGAIAAAAAAAAEYGRRHGIGTAFRGLEELPGWLGSGGNLRALFQPQPATEGVYRTALAFVTGGAAAWPRRLGAAVANFPLGALLGAVPGALLAGAVAAAPHGGWLRPLGLAVAAGVLAAGAVLGAAAALARSALRAIPENFYGLCSGNEVPDAAPPAGGARPALTPWLAGLLGDLSGKTDPAAPLTFGDLWGQRDPNGAKDVNLEVMTTNLTHGRPYRVPLDTRIFLFAPDEWRALFPAPLVDWMVACASRLPNAGRHAPWLLPFPEPADVPVVVAARMSLSFPVLLSAVPLYAVDHSRNYPGAQRVPERCWFSDGGICSNFPVHFFDAPLPRWPTFGINLRSFHPDRDESADERRNVFMPADNYGGMTEWWTRFDAPPEPPARSKSPPPPIGPTRVVGFLAAVFNAMQNWRDNVQLNVPGYRDRVVHVYLDESRQGGLNLDMPPEVIARLSARGRAAGELLRARYAELPTSPTGVSWDNHRWVRYRILMDRIEDVLRKARESFDAPPEAGDRPYPALVARAEGEPPTSYPWSRVQAAAAPDATRQLFRLSEQWAADGLRFSPGAPRGRTEMRIVPRA